VRVRARTVTAFALLLVTGCLGDPLGASGVATWGTPTRGRILGVGAALPDRGPGFVRARPGEDTRHGTTALVAALTRAAAAVDAAHPGTVPVRIGDLSGPGGGRHARHRSHRSGRDADVLFYALDAEGRATDGAGFFAFDRFGVARDARPLVGRAKHARPALRYLDVARTWTFFRALLADDDVPLQWIFCSAGVKAQILAHAIAHERDPALLLRASYVLQQPSNGRPHDDHFHVRLACTAHERASGCDDNGPVWPWLRTAHEKPEVLLGEPLDDAALLHALLDDAPEEPQRAAP
jgi:penicillin-insensitive murein endopeptidase